VTSLQKETPSPLSSHQQQDRRSKDIAERHKTIETLFQDIYVFDDAERSAGASIVDCIRRLAIEFEEIMLQKEQQFFINTICSQICRRFHKDKKYWLRQYAVTVLDSKYKRKQNEESYRRSEQTHADLPEECSIEENMILGQLQRIRDKVDLYNIPGKGIQKINDVIQQIERKLRSHADMNGIAMYSPNDNKSSMDEINDESDKAYEEKISEIPLPIPLDTAIRQVDHEAFEATIKLAEVVKAWAVKQRDYSRSQTLQDAISWRDAIIAITMIIKQYVDGKARRSYDQWGDMLKVMAEHGGTAASSKSAMPVTDPDTGKPMVDPRTLQTVYRDITKEQIDARGPRYASEIDFMVRQTVFTDMMEERFIRLTCGSRNYRALSAREKLSRQA
jgi:hypothetical protein